MKIKYIDEFLKPYFLFGSYGPDKVNISNGETDVCLVTKQEAEKIISDRDKVFELLYKFNEKYPKEFEECFNNLINDKRTDYSIF